MDDMTAERTQRVAARIAGFLFLWLIVTGVAGMLTISHVAGSGSFAEQAKRVAASQLLYRAGLVFELVEVLSTVPLAFALYVTLEPVDELLARLAMYFRFGETFVGAAGMIAGFVKLQLYVSGTDQAQALMPAARQAGVAAYNVSAIFFSLGSLLFCRLFLRSGYIPKSLSALGVFASAVVTVMCLGTLLLPEHASTFQYGWAPMAIAEVVTGVWLMLFAVKTRPPVSAA